MAVIYLPSSAAAERGTWVIRFDIDTPEKVSRICSMENQSQFDRYLVQVRGRADSWYESDFVPKAEGIDFDPLAAIIEECRDVEIHAWVNVYYLWTGETPPADPSHPYYNDDWILHDRNGRSVKEYTPLEQRQRWIEGVYADPASEEYLDYFTKVVQEIVTNYNVAGVHLDFVRYPGSFFGGGEQPVLSRMGRVGLAVLYNGSGDEAARRLLRQRLAWEEQRAAHITALVAGVKEVMAKVDPALKLSASVFPDPVEAFLDKGQKWSDWLALGLVDELYVMAYFGERSRVVSQLGQCKTICDRYGVPMWAGLGAYIKSDAEIQDEIRAANRAGVTDVCLFSLGHLLKQRKNIEKYQLNAVVEKQGEEMALSPLVEYMVRGGYQNEIVNIKQIENPSRATRSLKLRGIFRYVDTHDEYAKVEDQYEIMRTIQQKLQRGVPFTRLSRKYSQAGTRRQGGLLADLPYDEAENRGMQGLFDLKRDAFSEIIAVHNGFWIFQVL